MRPCFTILAFCVALLMLIFFLLITASCGPVKASAPPDVEAVEIKSPVGFWCYAIIDNSPGVTDRVRGGNCIKSY